MWPFRRQNRKATRSLPARLVARYDAAQTTSENARHWAMADSLSADSAASADVRRKLRERARYEVANNSYAKGIVLTLAKAKLGIDLLQPEAPPAADPEGPPLLTRLGTDEMLLGEALCALLEHQFEAHQVTAADVQAGFDGNTLLAAQKAFYKELIDFFRSRGRNDRAKAVAKQVAMIDAAIAAIETRIDGIDIDQTIRGAMSGDLPAASASGPTSSTG